jgi:hypothetical protein
MELLRDLEPTEIDLGPEAPRIRPVVISFYWVELLVAVEVVYRAAWKAVSARSVKSESIRITMLVPQELHFFSNLHSELWSLSHALPGSRSSPDVQTLTWKNLYFGRRHPRRYPYPDQRRW